ncbi:MAG: hypothetical protein BroJett018_16360 [Chloroflexota bacterium]|nr:hypothetical protein [Chloroflexota bacterium]NOG65679.1 hypothetical protein [Chloroflexota bacterium]GIK63842.1 MAG: hypothetical protein BroJett018_16360 [Chloroflexota bacterium]
MTQTNRQAYQHAEAFRMMTYECQTCGKRLLVWNSRDGVTPFSMTCRLCGKGSMIHINWSNDPLMPRYIPQVGDWIWVDMPAKKCKKLGVPVGSPRLIQVDERYLRKTGKA